MPIETDADRLAMLSDWDSVIFSPGLSYPTRGGDAVTISGILNVDFIETVDTESTEPTVMVRTSDLVVGVGVKHGSMVEEGSNKYKVVGIQPDGQGMTTLILEGP